MAVGFRYRNIEHIIAGLDSDKNALAADRLEGELWFVDSGVFNVDRKNHGGHVVSITA